MPHVYNFFQCSNNRGPYYYKLLQFSVWLKTNLFLITTLKYPALRTFPLRRYDVPWRVAIVSKYVTWYLADAATCFLNKIFKSHNILLTFCFVLNSL